MRQQSPITVVMEACYSSHYWGREIAKLGHDTKLIPAQHVTPFVQGNKNDHNDAFAIAKASQRANIRFVPAKPEHQQEIFCLHRIRERLIKKNGFEQPV
jgi:transposase